MLLMSENECCLPLMHPEDSGGDFWQFAEAPLCICLGVSPAGSTPPSAAPPPAVPPSPPLPPSHLGDPDTPAAMPVAIETYCKLQVKDSLCLIVTLIKAGYHTV